MNPPHRACFTANSVNYVINVPDADITLGPSVSLATTTFNAATSRWETTADFGPSGNTFLAGVAVPAIVSLPGGINPVAILRRSSRRKASAYTEHSCLRPPVQ